MYAALCRTMANWWISLPMSAPAVANKNAFWCRIRTSCIGSTLHPKIALIVVKHDYLFIETGGPGLDASAIAWTARPSPAGYRWADRTSVASGKGVPVRGGRGGCGV